jgi:hypothetical protein
VTKLILYQLALFFTIFPSKEGFPIASIVLVSLNELPRKRWLYRSALWGFCPWRKTHGLIRWNSLLFWGTSESIPSLLTKEHYREQGRYLRVYSFSNSKILSWAHIRKLIKCHQLCLDTNELFHILWVIFYQLWVKSSKSGLSSLETSRFDRS